MSGGNFHADGEKRKQPCILVSQERPVLRVFRLEAACPALWNKCNHIMHSGTTVRQMISTCTFPCVQSASLVIVMFASMWLIFFLFSLQIYKTKVLMDTPHGGTRKVVPIGSDRWQIANNSVINYALADTTDRYRVEDDEEKLGTIHVIIQGRPIPVVPYPVCDTTEIQDFCRPLAPDGRKWWRSSRTGPFQGQQPGKQTSDLQ